MNPEGTDMFKLFFFLSVNGSKGLGEGGGGATVHTWRTGSSPSHLFSTHTQLSAFCLAAVG